MKKADRSNASTMTRPLKYCAYILVATLYLIAAVLAPVSAFVPTGADTPDKASIERAQVESATAARFVRAQPVAKQTPVIAAFFSECFSQSAAGDAAALPSVSHASKTLSGHHHAPSDRAPPAA